MLSDEAQGPATHILVCDLKPRSRMVGACAHLPSASHVVVDAWGIFAQTNQGYVDANCSPYARYVLVHESVACMIQP